MSNNNKQSNGKKQISRVGRSHSSRQNDRTSRNDVDSFADDLPALFLIFGILWYKNSLICLSNIKV